jgi:hypothetical protein
MTPRHPKLARIGSFIPSFAAWLERAQNAAGDVSLTGYKSEAERLLANIADEFIDQACRELVGRSAKRDMERLPFAVAKLAKQLERRALLQRHAQQVSDSCQLCAGTGVVLILHPKTVEELQRHQQVPSIIHTAAVACQCHAGQILASCRYWRFYRPEADVVVSRDELPREACTHYLTQMFNIPIDDVPEPSIHSAEAEQTGTARAAESLAPPTETYEPADDTDDEVPF